MSKPLHYYQFRFVGGMWRDVAGDGGVLADILSEWEIEIDHRTQFARLKDYERGLQFLFRAYSCAMIELTISKLACEYGHSLHSI